MLVVDYKVTPEELTKMHHEYCMVVEVEKCDEDYNTFVVTISDANNNEYKFVEGNNYKWKENEFCFVVATFDDNRNLIDVEYVGD